MAFPTKNKNNFELSKLPNGWKHRLHITMDPELKDLTELYDCKLLKLQEDLQSRD